MTVTVIAFGIVKELFGGSSITMDIDSGDSVEQLRTRLEHRYPRLKAIASYLIAVNNEYATPEELIKATDEIAVIPPVSGG